MNRFQSLSLISTRFVAIWMLLVFSASFLSCSPVKDYVRAGDDYCSKKDAENAKEEYRKAYLIKPGDKEILERLCNVNEIIASKHQEKGKGYENAREYGAAKKEYSQAKILYEESYSYASQYDPVLKRSLEEKAKILQPSLNFCMVQDCISKARSILIDKEWERAISLLNQCKTSAHLSDALSKQIDQELKSIRTKKSEFHYEEASRIYGSGTINLVTLEKAISELDKSLKENPENKKSSELKSHLIQKRDQVKKDSEGYYKEAKASLECGDFQKAVEKSKLAIQLDSNSYQAKNLFSLAKSQYEDRQFQLGNDSVKEGNWVSAVRYFFELSEFLQEYPEDRERFDDLSNYLKSSASELIKSLYREAEEDYEKRRAYDPQKIDPEKICDIRKILVLDFKDQVSSDKVRSFLAEYRLGDGFLRNRFYQSLKRSNKYEVIALNTLEKYSASGVRDTSKQNYGDIAHSMNCSGFIAGRVKVNIVTTGDTEKWIVVVSACLYRTEPNELIFEKRIRKKTGNYDIYDWLGRIRGAMSPVIRTLLKEAIDELANGFEPKRRIGCRKDELNKFVKDKLNNLFKQNALPKSAIDFIQNELN